MAKKTLHQAQPSHQAHQTYQAPRKVLLDLRLCQDFRDDLEPSEGWVASSGSEAHVCVVKLETLQSMYTMNGFCCHSVQLWGCLRGSPTLRRLQMKAAYLHQASYSHGTKATSSLASGGFGGKNMKRPSWLDSNEYQELTCTLLSIWADPKTALHQPK